MQSQSSRRLELPFLGVGISATIERASLTLRSPDAANAVSLASLGFLNLGMNSAAVVPTELPRELERAGLEAVVHFEDVNLVGSAVDEEKLERLAASCRVLRPRWLQEDLGIWQWGGLPLVEHMLGPILDERSLQRATDNITRIMDATGLPFLAENPPMYFVIGDIDLLSFMTEVSRRSGCGLLLDIGHFVAYCLCTQREPGAYLAAHPGFLDLVVELHLAGYALTEVADSPEPIWFDRHDLPLSEDSLKILDQVLSGARGVKAITLEVEGASDDVIRRNVADVLERVSGVAA